MPRAATWCLGCGVPTSRGSHCADCAASRQRPQDARPSAARRGYGPRHRRRRAAFLAKYPYCQHRSSAGRLDCQAAATELDHVTPLADGGADDESNYQGLCKPHHSSKTAVQSSGWGAPR